MSAPVPWLQQESRRCLQSLLQSNSISLAAYQHVWSVLDKEWGQYGPPQTQTGHPDTEFQQLDSHLRELAQQHALSTEALGNIYMTLSQERGACTLPCPAAHACTCDYP